MSESINPNFNNLNNTDTLANIPMPGFQPMDVSNSSNNIENHQINLNAPYDPNADYMDVIGDNSSFDLAKRRQYKKKTKNDLMPISRPTISAKMLVNEASAVKVSTTQSNQIIADKRILSYTKESENIQTSQTPDLPKIQMVQSNIRNHPKLIESLQRSPQLPQYYSNNRRHMPNTFQNQNAYVTNSNSGIYQNIINIPQIPNTPQNVNQTYSVPITPQRIQNQPQNVPDNINNQPRNSHMMNYPMNNAQMVIRSPRIHNYQYVNNNFPAVDGQIQPRPNVMTYQMRQPPVSNIRYQRQIVRTRLPDPNTIIKELNVCYQELNNLEKNPTFQPNCEEINSKKRKINQLRNILNMIRQNGNRNVINQNIQRPMVNYQGNRPMEKAVPVPGQQRFNLSELPEAQQKSILQSISEAQQKKGQQIGKLQSVVIIRTPQGNGLPPKQQIIVQQLVKPTDHQNNTSTPMYKVYDKNSRLRHTMSATNKVIEDTIKRSNIFDESKNAYAHADDENFKNMMKYKENRPSYAKRKYTKKNVNVIAEGEVVKKKSDKKKRKNIYTDDNSSDDIMSEIEEYEEEKSKSIITLKGDGAFDMSNIPTRKSTRTTSRKRYVDDDAEYLKDDFVAETKRPKKEAKPIEIVNKVEDYVKCKIKPDNPEKKTEPVIPKDPIEYDTTMNIEKVLGDRENVRFKLAEYSDLVKTEINDIEYLVKYRHFSYLHCEWKTEEELMGYDSRIKQKIKRYRMKKAFRSENLFDSSIQDAGVFYNPNYCLVDRILDVSDSLEPKEPRNNGEKKLYYLVKWLSLPYMAATWEIAEEVDKEKIEEFYKIRNDKELAKKIMKRPPPPINETYMWRKVQLDKKYKNDNMLRNYQVEGVNWLNYNYVYRQPCILADEMGLGKTIQSIGHINELYCYGIRGPFLIIVPLSTLSNWYREFQEWTDINPVVYHGTSEDRKMIQKYEFFYRENDVPLENIFKMNVLITTYEIIISDIDILAKIYWRSAIIDEAHRLKNRNSRLLISLKAFSVEHKILLTGTPLQNNVTELFSLLNFLEPDRFNHLPMFLGDFGDLKTIEQVNKLKVILKPMMLRRLKEDVEKSLAPKEETIIEVELTNIQKKYYRAILEGNFSFLTNQTSGALPSLVNTMMELRKCCNHPFLIKGAEDKIISTAKTKLENHELITNPNVFYDCVVKSCGKLVLIDKLLPRLKNNNHRVLIFSQMIRVLDILEDYLINRGYLYERLDGRIHGNKRQESIDRFNRPKSDRFVFLLCTRAGGLGINLTAADTVIIYDSDWNPQNDLQAQARCHRIGQTKPVKIYRLITRNTYEREMFDKASLKLGLDRAVLNRASTVTNDTEGTNDYSTSKPVMSRKEVEKLLRKGAYAAVMDDDGSEDTFCEEDIDHILERRTTTVKVGDSGEVGSTFSKASFSASYNRNDIDIDDPNFWDKWSKKVNFIQQDPLESLIMMTPRRRKQNQKFDDSENSDDYKDPKETKKLKKKLSRRKSKRVNMKPSKYMENQDSENSAGSNEEGYKSKEDRKRPGRPYAKIRQVANHLCQHGISSKQRVVVTPGYDMKTCCCIYSRKYFFRIEKKMMKFGWGEFSRVYDMLVKELPIIFEEFTLDCLIKQAKSMVMFALKHYVGDTNIKSFLYELVNDKSSDEQSNDVESEKSESKNNDTYNYGLLNPVPRGRKSKKSQQAAEKLTEAIFYEDEQYKMDDSFKRHLKRHSQKFLLRVRLMYYLKMELLGSETESILNGRDADEIMLFFPPNENPKNSENPTWWCEKCDKSLLIGVYKHGFDSYKNILLDETLYFSKVCSTEQVSTSLKNNEDSDNTDKESVGDEEDTIDYDIDESSKISSPIKTESILVDDQTCLTKKYTYPSDAELTVKFRRLITRFQRWQRRSQLDDEKMAKRIERRMKMVEIMMEKERYRNLCNKKWSVREQSDFLKNLNNFGIEYNEDANSQLESINWENFKKMAKLDRKNDESLNKHLTEFYEYCSTILKKNEIDNVHDSIESKECDFEIKKDNVLENDTLSSGLGSDGLSQLYTPFDMVVSVEKALKIFYRSQLINRIRCKILKNPKFEERIKMCNSANDMPFWWIPGLHDLHLLKGVAKHGLGKMYFNILCDETFDFIQILKQRLQEPNILFKLCQMKLIDNVDVVLTTQCLMGIVTSLHSFKYGSNKQKKKKKQNGEPLINNETEIPEKTESSNESNNRHNDFFFYSYIIEWPKDRIILYRIKNLSNLIETGIWIDSPKRTEKYSSINAFKNKTDDHGYCEMYDDGDINTEEYLNNSEKDALNETNRIKSDKADETEENFEKVLSSIKTLSNFHTHMLKSIYKNSCKTIKPISKLFSDAALKISELSGTNGLELMLNVSPNTLVALTSVDYFDKQFLVKLSDLMDTLKKDCRLFVDPLDRSSLNLNKEIPIQNLITTSQDRESSLLETSLQIFPNISKTNIEVSAKFPNFNVELMTHYVKLDKGLKKLLVK